MVNFVDTIWLLIGGIIVTIVLGIIAGFSPTLYMTQIGIGGAKSKGALPYMIAIMIGVVLALVVLTILFQFFHLNTLIEFIDTTVNALLVSVVFNILIGLAMIGGGMWYLRHRDLEAKPLSSFKKSGYAALVSFGFLRTFISITGVTATFIASNVIAEASPGILLRIILTFIFLAASIVPFVAIVFLLKSNPTQMTALVDRVKSLLKKLNYRPVIGVGAILFGSSIVIYNVLMAVFY